MYVRQKALHSHFFNKVFFILWKKSGKNIFLSWSVTWSFFILKLWEYLPISHLIHKPSLFLRGSLVIGSTLISPIGRTELGRNWGKQPTAPILLSRFTETKILEFVNNTSLLIVLELKVTFTALFWSII